MKILIAVVTCHHAKYMGYHEDSKSRLGGERIGLIRDTWKKKVPQGVDLKFFFGRPGKGQRTRPEPDEVFLDVHDAFFAIPRKTQAILKYALDHGYTHTLVVMDDVWINVPAILQSDFHEHDYLGNARNLGNSDVPFKFVSGFAVWFSRKSMEIVASAEVPWRDFDKEFDIDIYKNSTNVEKIQWHDDLWIGQTLAAHGIEAHDDERYVINIAEVETGLGPASTYPLDKAFAIHAAPANLMWELVRR